MCACPRFRTPPVSDCARALCAGWAGVLPRVFMCHAVLLVHVFAALPPSRVCGRSGCSLLRLSYVFEDAENATEWRCRVYVLEEGPHCFVRSQ